MMQEFEVMVDKLTAYRFCTYVISLSQKYSETKILLRGNGGLEIYGKETRLLGYGHYC